MKEEFFITWSSNVTLISSSTIHLFLLEGGLSMSINDLQLLQGYKMIRYTSKLHTKASIALKT